MKKNVVLEVKKAVSKKGNEYVAVYIDLGYRRVYPQFKSFAEVAEVLDMRPNEMNALLDEEAKEEQ